MTAVTENNIDTYIPAEDEVQASTSGVTWRFANGLICTGSEDKGTIQSRDKIVGRFRRVGIHDKTYTKTDGDRRVYQLECDIETASGITRVAASLCSIDGKDQASGVACGLAWGLLQLAKDELMIFTAGKSKEKNKYGSYSTFVNTFTLKPGAKQGVEVPRRGKSDDTLEETLEKLLAQIKMHPAYADRPVAESDAEDGTPNTHLSALCQLAAAHAWPTPEQAPADWLAFYAAWRQTPGDVKVSLSEISDDDWGQLMLNLIARGEQGVNGKPATWAVPKPLEAAAARLSTANSALD